MVNLSHFTSNLWHWGFDFSIHTVCMEMFSLCFRGFLHVFQFPFPSPKTCVQAHWHVRIVRSMQMGVWVCKRALHGVGKWLASHPWCWHPIHGILTLSMVSPILHPKSPVIGSKSHVTLCKVENIPSKFRIFISRITVPVRFCVSLCKFPLGSLVWLDMLGLYICVWCLMMS